MNHYWTNTIQTRISRRRALAASGAGVLGAAFLAACGGSNSKKTDKDQASGDKTGLLATPSDSTDRAKTGGVLKLFAQADPIQGLDTLASNHANTFYAATFAYSRLLKNTVEKYPKDASQTVEGDVAESYELSPDKLSLTMKIRQGIKWDSRAPTNSRVLDAQDILFSWNKFARVHPSRAELAYDAQTAKTAPIESISSPDARTIVFKLKAPDVSLLPMLASVFYMFVMPRESDGGFDPKSDQRGSGPFMLDEYIPSSRMVWRRNPDYYMKGRPFPDRVEQPIVPEYAQRLAQFRSGNIYTSVATQDDIIQTKKDVPDALLLQATGYPAMGGMAHLTFGYEGDSPWKDQRMRQALSMTVDREAMIDAVYNRDRFVSQGFDVPAAHHSFLLPGWTGYWLDPTNEKEFGPNAKYLNFNVAEAKKLMAAAGNPNGVDFKLSNVPTFPPPNPRMLDVWAGMFRDGGFKVTQLPLSQTDWYRDYYFAYATKDPVTGKAKGFNGVNQVIERSGPTVPATFYGFLHKDSGFYKGVSPDGRNVEQGDPKLNDMIDKMRVEFDVVKQQALAQDAQRLVAGQAYSIPNSGTVKSFNLMWPALGNAGAYKMFGSPTPTPVGPGASWQEDNYNWWIDSSKAPLGHS